jgi:hypothetical protein
LLWLLAFMELESFASAGDGYCKIAISLITDWF